VYIYVVAAQHTTMLTCLRKLSASTLFYYICHLSIFYKNICIAQLTGFPEVRNIEKSKLKEKSELRRVAIIESRSYIVVKPTAQWVPVFRLRRLIRSDWITLALRAQNWTRINQEAPMTSPFPYYKPASICYRWVGLTISSKILCNVRQTDSLDNLLAIFILDYWCRVGELISLTWICMRR
jgi:hypothetical protein